MGPDQTRAIVSGGLTGSLVVIGAAFQLAFPDMIVPFGWAMALLVAGLVGLASTVWFGVRAYLNRPLPKQPQLQPYLRAQFREKDVRLKFEIKNLGPGDVQIESYEMSTGEGFSGSLHVDLLTCLPEAGCVTIDPLPVFKRDLGPFVRLKMNFRGKDGGALGTAEYTFFAPDESNLSSAPTSWAQRPGHEITSETSMLSAMEQLLQPVGTIALVLMKRTKDGTANQLGIETDNRRFYFDPLHLFARFETHSGTTIRRVTADLPPADDKTAYLIFIVWNDPANEMAINVSQGDNLLKFNTCETVNLILGPSWDPILTPSLTAS